MDFYSNSTEYRRAYYARNKARMLYLQRLSRARRKEKIKQGRLTYRQSHHQAILAKDAAYRAANREKLCEKARAYRLAHLEEEKARVALWRARKQNAPRHDLTAAQWKAIKEHYGHRCVYCGRKMQRLTQDHIIPLSKGGTHTVQNVVPACLSCNSKKQAGPPLKPVQPLLLTAV